MWERVKSVDGGANTDFTNMGQCNGMNIITLYYSWKQFYNFYSPWTVFYWSRPSTDNTYFFWDKRELGWKLIMQLFFYDTTTLALWSLQSLDIR